MDYVLFSTKGILVFLIVSYIFYLSCSLLITSINTILCSVYPLHYLIPILAKELLNVQNPAVPSIVVVRVKPPKNHLPTGSSYHHLTKPVPKEEEKNRTANYCCTTTSALPAECPCTQVRPRATVQRTRRTARHW